MWVEPLDSLSLKLRAGTVQLQRGVPVELPNEVARALLTRAPGTARQIDTGRCYSCQSRRKWLSIHGAVICGLCHPPVIPGLVVRWLDGEATR